MTLWNNLLPERKLTERKTMEWVDIGFQGKDPATDFRGAGVLGFQQLLDMTDKESSFRDHALKMFKDSSDKETWYFFCVAGLNITGKLLVSLSESTDLDKHIIPIFQKLPESEKKVPESIFSKD